MTTQRTAHVLILCSLTLPLIASQASRAQLSALGNQVFTQADLPGVSAEAGDYFGASLSAGDFNGDGFDDLAVGSPFEAVGTTLLEGIVHVFYGGPTGFQATQTQLFTTADLSFPVPVDWTEALVGYSLESLRIDGDAYDDLVIGVPGAETYAGVVFAVSGSSSGLDASSMTLATQESFGGTPAQGNAFGWSLASCDVDGDDRDDLLVGAPGTSSSEVLEEGAVGVLPLGEGSPSPREIKPSDLDLAQPFGSFGGSIACADFDGDGKDDVAAGTGAGDPAESGIIVVRGSSTVALTLVGSQVITANSLLGQNPTFQALGSALAAAKVDEDAYADLLIADSLSQDGGAIQIVPGSSSGLVAASPQELGQDQTTVESDETDDFCGAAILTADFDLDGHPEVVLGGPGEDLPSPSRGDNIDEGAILVFPGTGSGPTGSGATLWTQSVLGRNAEALDYFGAVLESGDFNGDGAPDLAVGIPRENVSTLQDAGALLIIYSQTPPLFADGFESGDLGAWTP